MSISHHPSTELLLDYAAGGLAQAWALAVATHAALCRQCRADVGGMEALGGSLLETLPGTALGGTAWDSILSRIDRQADAAIGALHTADASTSILPEPLRSFAGRDLQGLAWQRLGLGASQVILPTGDRGITARLLRIPAGRPVPRHSHRGLELTLVLDGAFSDATGRYGRGDLQTADDTLEHQPHAEPGTDCVCLAVTEGPLRFSTFAARLAQRFLDI